MFWKDKKKGEQTGACSGSTDELPEHFWYLIELPYALGAYTFFWALLFGVGPVWIVLTQSTTPHR